MSLEHNESNNKVDCKSNQLYSVICKPTLDQLHDLSVLKSQDEQNNKQINKEYCESVGCAPYNAYTSPYLFWWSIRDNGQASVWLWILRAHPSNQLGNELNNKPNQDIRLIHCNSMFAVAGSVETDCWVEGHCRFGRSVLTQIASSREVHSRVLNFLSSTFAVPWGMV